MNQKPKGYWTKETVKGAIIERYLNKKGLSPGVMYKENQQVIRKGIQLFGGWREALEYAGVDWEEVYKNKPNGYWGKDEVRNRLRERLGNGKGLNPTELSEEDRELYAAARNIYGSLDKAYNDIGENRADHLQRKPQGYWSKETVTSELEMRIMQGLSLKPEDIRDDNSVLYKMINRSFGGWEEAYVTIGKNIEDYRTRRERRDWSKETVVQELLKRKSKGLLMSASQVHKEDISLYKNTIKYFGKWKDALTAIGIE